LTKAWVIHPHNRNNKDDTNLRSADARLVEAVNLSEALNLDIVHSEIVRIDKKNAGYLLGKGWRERAHDEMKEQGIEVAIINTYVTPVQQRNLEKELHVKVMDRTGLILEIFGDRAQTREGVLQVRLAHLQYQKSRLVRSWTHLERQRGGAGFMGGPGERQIESDRRQLSDQIFALRARLAQVAKTRDEQRKSRRDSMPLVAFVGYTNAGKSTVFNKLTKGGVLAKDMLFATLDPTVRIVEGHNNQKILMLDTVGFVSDLPTQLVAAFRATLSEILEATHLVHVRDISHDDTDAQKQDVLDVLKAIGVEDDKLSNMIEIQNKSDLLDNEQFALYDGAAERDPYTCLVSCVTQDGADTALDLIYDIIKKDHFEYDFKIDFANGALRSWLYKNSDVSDETAEEDGILISGKIDEKHYNILKSMHPELIDG